MLVKLPRECSGQEIVEALKSASMFSEGPEKKWESQEFVDEFQYEPGSVKQTVRSMGVSIRTYLLKNKKKWIFWGKSESIWKQDFTPKFTLEPVVLSLRYNRVYIKVEYVYKIDQGGFEYTANDPREPEFENIRPNLERILAGFYARLQPQAT